MPVVRPALKADEAGRTTLAWDDVSRAIGELRAGRSVEISPPGDDPDKFYDEVRGFDLFRKSVESLCDRVQASKSPVRYSVAVDGYGSKRLIATRTQ